MRKEQEIRSFEEKQFLLTELMIIKSTLTIGYWSVDEQEKLLPILLKLLGNKRLYIFNFDDSIGKIPKDK